MSEPKLGGPYPRNGYEYAAQCGRCGSTLIFEDCNNCGGDGVVDHDCGEDTCACAKPELNVGCGVCGGAGGFPLCCSTEEWCKENPIVGRENVQRATVEWYRRPADCEVHRG